MLKKLPYTNVNSPILGRFHSLVNVSLNLFDDKISYGDGFSYYKELSSFQAAQAGLSSL